MARRLRLGLLGTGVAAVRLYLPAFQATRDRIEVVACANRRRAKAARFARMAGIPKVVETAEELLQLADLDAVLISLPIELTPRYVLEALRAGKAVLSEKPVAPSVRDGERLTKAAARFDSPWLVGENYAFMPHVLRLRRWIQSGRLGEVRLVQATQINWMDRRNPYFATSWRKSPVHVGGFVVDGGVHLAHVVRSCFGMPRSIKNLTAAFDPALPPLDTAVAALEFDSGALGTWTSCFSARYDGPMLRVYGSKANAELGWNVATLQTPKGEPQVFRTTADSFAEEFRHFADMVLRGAPPALSPRDALDDLRLVEAIVSGGRTRLSAEPDRARRPRTR